MVTILISPSLFYRNAKEQDINKVKDIPKKEQISFMIGRINSTS